MKELWPGKLKHMALGPIQIGFTNTCNFDCTMCVLHQNKGCHFMPASMFKHLVSDVKNCGTPVSSLVLQWYGESLTHPDFADCMEYLASESGPWLGGVSLSTNGYFFSEKIGRTFLNMSEKVPVTIVFSVDSASAETFKKIKQVNAFEKVTENIECFLKIRAQDKKSQLRVMIQFLVVPENAEEGVDFINSWKRRFASLGEPVEVKASAYNIDEYRNVINIKAGEFSDFEVQQAVNAAYEKIAVNAGLISTYDMRQKKQVIETISEAKKKHNDIRKPCWSMFFSPSVDHNGDVTVCCSDNMMQLKVGNLKENSLTSCWQSNKAAAMRIAQLSGQWHKIPYCDACNCFAHGKYHALSDEEEMYFKDLYAVHKEYSHTENTCETLMAMIEESPENEVLIRSVVQEYWKDNQKKLTDFFIKLADSCEVPLVYKTAGIACAESNNHTKAVCFLEKILTTHDSQVIDHYLQSKIACGKYSDAFRFIQEHGCQTDMQRLCYANLLLLMKKYKAAYSVLDSIQDLSLRNLADQMFLTPPRGRYYTLGMQAYENKEYKKAVFYLENYLMHNNDKETAKLIREIKKRCL